FRILERTRLAINISTISKLRYGGIEQDIVQGYDIEHGRHVTRITNQNPGRVFNVNKTCAADFSGKPHQPGHRRAGGCIVKPAIVVGIILDTWLAESIQKRS